MPIEHSSLEYLTTTRIGEKGQLTVPKQYRDDLGLDPGAPFAVLRMGSGLLLIPEQRRFEQLCEQIGSALNQAGVSANHLVEDLPAIREQIFKERYGDIGAVDSEASSGAAKLVP
jgi:AbrB family looped-hinge helix DNA binding protein